MNSELTFPLRRGFIHRNVDVAILLAIFSFVLGASIGSFLNVCIYRMPLGLSVNQPRRSFCPKCKTQIPWHQNLPLISWLALRAKCARCGCGISFRYFAVELLTGLLFLAIYHTQPWQFLLPFWILASLLIVATFIDFEHFIIPDEITIGGTVAGLLLSLAIPALMGVQSHWLGLLWSFIGAAVGFGILFAVVELGKLVFGKKRIVFERKTVFTWTRNGDDATLVFSENGKDGEQETMPWSELFSRESDKLVMQCADVKIDGETLPKNSLRFFYDRLKIGEREWPLAKVDAISGNVSEVVIPREAMGFGDVKFIAAIGAFLGWEAVLFTIVAASCIGAIIGVAAILAGKREASAKIPFGPYLALGALIWIFVGAAILHWYFHLIAPAIS